MKKLDLRILFITLFSILQASAMNIQEMEEGAEAMVKIAKNGIEGAKKTEQIRFFQYAAVMEGFLVGVNSADLNVPNFKQRPSHNPEKWMHDPELSSKSILDFIKTNIPKTYDKDTDNATDLYFFLWAWYYKSHSKSTRLDKGLADDYLLLFTPGGRDELKKENKMATPRKPSD